MAEIILFHKHCAGISFAAAAAGHHPWQNEPAVFRFHGYSNAAMPVGILLNIQCFEQPQGKEVCAALRKFSIVKRIAYFECKFFAHNAFLHAVIGNSN